MPTTNAVRPCLRCGRPTLGTYWGGVKFPQKPRRRGRRVFLPAAKWRACGPGEIVLCQACARWPLLLARRMRDDARFAAIAGAAAIATTAAGTTASGATEHSLTVDKPRTADTLVEP